MALLILLSSSSSPCLLPHTASLGVLFTSTQTTRTSSVYSQPVIKGRTLLTLWLTVQFQWSCLWAAHQQLQSLCKFFIKWHLRTFFILVCLSVVWVSSDHSLWQWLVLILFGVFTWKIKNSGYSASSLSLSRFLINTLKLACLWLLKSHTSLLELGFKKKVFS